MTINIEELRRRIDWGYKVANGVVIELLDRLEAAEKERDALRDRIEVTDEVVRELEKKLSTGMWRALREENEALRAKIAEMERQEPVRHEFQGRDGAWYPFIDQRHYENTVADGTWPIRALYALPGAKETITWQPIETAPKDNKCPLFLARFNDDGTMQSFDYDGSWERESESWEIPIVYYFWASENGNVEEPTHWMYQPEWFNQIPLVREDKDE